LIETDKGKGPVLSPRARNIELEAMKTRLAEGVIAAGPVPDSYRSGPWADVEPPEHLSKALAREALATARPSYFGRRDVPFAIPVAPFKLTDALYAAVSMVDALSVVHQTPFRARVLTGPTYNGNSDLIIGVWDAGKIGVTFDGEALIHGVTPRGRSVAVVVESLTIQLGNDYCGRSPLGIKTRSVKGSRLDSAIVAWVGKPPVDGKATVNVRRSDGQGEYDKLVIEDVDLDGDGVGDLSVWSGRFEYLVGGDGPEGHWKAVFANVVGTWKLVGYDQSDDCT
jgi:hypothetical protein